jgi:hypothetical protein
MHKKVYHRSLLINWLQRVSECAKRHRTFSRNIKNSAPMKNGQHSSIIDAIDNRIEISNHKVTVPKAKLSSGSVADKYPVILDDGRTIIYIADKSREREIRLRYALRQG